MENLLCGIDFHKNKTEICMKDFRGKILKQDRIETKRIGEYFSNLPHMKLAIEASSGVTYTARQLREAGHEVEVVDPQSFRMTGLKGKKNDKRDSEALADYLRMGLKMGVYVKPEVAVQSLSLIKHREILMQSRIKLTNHVRGILRDFGYSIPQGRSAFMMGVKSIIDESDNELLVKQLKIMLEIIVGLLEKEICFEKEVEKLCKEIPQTKKLMTIPGVGVLTSMAFLFTLVDWSRFKDGHRVSSYLGLVPREYSSGDKKRFGRITKSGSSLVRKLLVHGARTRLFLEKGNDKDPVMIWARGIEQRRGKSRALIALASKTARIMYAMLKDDSVYSHKKTL